MFYLIFKNNIPSKEQQVSNIIKIIIWTMDLSKNQIQSDKEKLGLAYVQETPQQHEAKNWQKGNISSRSWILMRGQWLCWNPKVSPLCSISCLSRRTIMMAWLLTLNHIGPIVILSILLHSRNKWISMKSIRDFGTSDTRKSSKTVDILEMWKILS